MRSHFSALTGALQPGNNGRVSGATSTAPWALPGHLDTPRAVLIKMVLPTSDLLLPGRWVLAVPGQPAAAIERIMQVARYPCRYPPGGYIWSAWRVHVPVCMHALRRARRHARARTRCAARRGGTATVLYPRRTGRPTGRPRVHVYIYRVPPTINSTIIVF